MKKYSLKALLLTLISCSFTNSSFETEVSTLVKKFKSPLISVGELKLNKDDFIVLDARELEEYQTSHLEHAIHIGYKDFNINNVDLDKKKTIVVYCSVGYRSGEIADKLNKSGYRAKNLFGGIFDWKNKGNSVYDSAGKLTQKVHTYNKNWSKWLTSGERVY